MATSLWKEGRKNGASTSKLKTNERIFVAALLADPQMNPAAAAREAGYKRPYQAAQRLLRKPEVNAILSKAVTKRAEELDINAARVLRELTYIGLLNPQEMFKEDGTMLNPRQMPEHVARAISGFEVETWIDDEGQPRSKIKVRLCSKNNALELIARHLGMLNDKLDLNSSIDQETLKLLVQAANTTQGKVVDVKAIEGPLSEEFRAES